MKFTAVVDLPIGDKNERDDMIIVLLSKLIASVAQHGAWNEEAIFVDHVNDMTQEKIVMRAIVSDTIDPHTIP